MREKIASEIVNVALSFERLFPRFIKIFLNRKLKEYKKMGLISDYMLRARRIGRLHYVFNIDIYRAL